MYDAASFSLVTVYQHYNTTLWRCVANDKLFYKSFASDSKKREK